MTNISQKWLNELQVLVPFTDNYSKPIHGSVLAKTIRLPQKTASRKLNKYCEMNFLRFKTEGRNKLYYLDLNEPSAALLIQLAELYKGLKFLSEHPKIKLLINDLLKINPVILFGSYAKGYATKESDIDLLMIGKNNKKIKEASDKYPFKTNIHYLTLKRFEKSLCEGNALAREIAKCHIIFERHEEFIKILLRYYQEGTNQ